MNNFHLCQVVKRQFPTRYKKRAQSAESMIDFVTRLVSIFLYEEGPFAPASSISAISSSVKSVTKWSGFLQRNFALDRKECGLRKSATSRYSCRRDFLVVVLHGCTSVRGLLTSIFPYVTITTPFDLTHDKMTCAGVAPILSAIFFSTGSTGPPGDLVIGLTPKAKVNNRTKKRESCWRECTVSLCDYSVFIWEIKEFLVVLPVIRMERYLRKTMRGRFCRMLTGWLTWLTAGLILAIFNKSCSCSMLKLLTPILLPSVEIVRTSK